MTDKHEHLDEGAIHAWLDDASTPDESARVEAASKTCAECAALVAEARGLIAASSRILSSLDTVPAGVIPGNSSGGDQLAALRARRSATGRRWWNDRRVVAAASLLFVAGVSSLVVRFAPADVTTIVAGQATKAAETFSDSAVPAEVSAPPPPPASAPVVANAPAVAREAPARDARKEAVTVPSPTPVAIRAVDPVESKVAAGASQPVIAGAARSDSVTTDRTAETRQAVAERSALQQSVQQSSARQGFQQLRADTVRPQAPPPSIGDRSRVARPMTGAAANAGAAESCYRLRPVPSASAPEPGVALPDTVQLLNERVPVRSDPTWYRTRAFGAGRDTTLAWRLVDSITVELRAGLGADSLGVRFKTTGAVPELGIATGVRAALAMPVTCP